MSEQIQKRVVVEIISLDGLEVGYPCRIGGWGEKATKTSAAGEVAQIIVRRGEESQFGIRILEDGSIIVTSYGVLFEQSVDRNLRLTNVRPWKEK